MTSASSERLLSAALSYGKRGWPVFPLVPGQKTPITKTGFKEAQTERDFILAWWHVTPDANIGLRTGVAFDVLDIDGREAGEALRRWIAEGNYGPYTHAGPVSLTGKIGGAHLLFAPTGSGNRAGLLPGLDYRGEGGYIVAPPSVHPSGRVYRWDHSRDSETPLPAAPDWLTELLTTSSEVKVQAAPRGLVGEYERGGKRIEPLQSGKIYYDRPSIIEVARELGLYVVQQGNHVFARCPFHKGYDVARMPSGTPSMQLDTAKNNFYCHACHAYGDSFDLKGHRDITGNTF